MNPLMQIAIASTLMLISQVASADEVLGQAPSIGGYSPVSYFTENKAELGSAEYAVEHDGRTYHLTSSEQVALFNANPGKYRPRHPFCSYSLAQGMTLPLDPTNFKVIDDSLLLFHKSEEKDALLEWNNSERSEEELLRRADSNLFLVEF
ncbi:MAG: YHS domain-containing (seleno)protein [Pseudomonadota bacterium]